MDNALRQFARLYQLEAKILEYARDPFLLLVRLVMGYQWFITGRGKFSNLDGVAAWFGNDLGIPMPYANAVAASSIELFGGVFLLLGLGSRIFTIPMVVTMCVAWATSDLDAVLKSTPWEPDPFLESAPFLYFASALLVLVFGPGKASIDHLIGQWWAKREGHDDA